MTQVAPQNHEAECWLYYGPVDQGDSESVDYDGLDPYWALSDLLINEFDGYHEMDTEIDGEPVTIRFTYSKSGFTPRPTDAVAGDRLYELEINIQGSNERKCDYNLSPRHPNMRNSEGEPTTTAFDHTDPDEGLSVHCQPSNMRLDEVPEFLTRAVFELADDADLALYHGYFDAPFGGRVSALERYVRITRSMNEKLIGTGGVMDRLAMLLSDTAGTKGMHKWDNEDERGHHHVIRHGSASASHLVSQHRLGGQLKSYLPEHPEEFEPDDPLYHPKVGTKFVGGRTDGGSVDWADRYDVVQELDERLLSILTWADIPTAAGGTTFVADDHFYAHAAADPVPIHSDPLPQLEAQQEHLLLTCLRDMTPADEDIVETLTADGGTHARDLSDETGLSLSTIYRCLDRMDGVLTSDNGHVRFVTDRLRREVRAIFESVEHQIETAADRVAEIVDQDVRQSASSAFDRWLAKYGAEFEPTESESERPVVRIDTVLSRFKYTDRPMFDDVLDEMGTAWKRDGRSIDQLADAIVEVSVDGTREQHRAATLW
ncbi:winged helix-turn-helix domain-containing protein [Halomicrobium sp. IBSBa]|uniref:winged helix-turn-helix domain-containing protein n=1 Tax=Halomicrobium sp. IBSBa TaxID=2778916 RepID=UPI001ABF396C|nr:winged helix-turn-helix domain-containing protein [Halomicrobium sp. IBSBa]MBO4248365.1 winged helix-turn-helix domain-containing protein [Halomicrobium sp. IBSBa]